MEEIERDAAQQQQQSAQYRERTARHEGLYPNCALTLQDAPLQLRSWLRTDCHKPVPDVCEDFTEELGLTGC